MNTEKVKTFIRENHLSCSAYARYTDLVSEVGELGKELLISTDYGQKPFQATLDMRLEAGDCLFSLLALLDEIHVEPEEALELALQKYEIRKQEKQTISSGN